MRFVVGAPPDRWIYDGSLSTGPVQGPLDIGISSDVAVWVERQASVRMGSIWELLMYEHLGEVMPRGAAKYGERVALVFDGEEFTYNRLNQLTARLANGLEGLGVSQGDRVTLYSQNRWEWVVSYHAALRLG